MRMALYDNAMQVVPVLLVALFLDTHSGEERQLSRRTQSWERLQDRMFAILSVIAFMVSMFVIAGVAEGGNLTEAIVIAALSSCISLLLARIWPRFDRSHDEDDDRQHGHIRTGEPS